MSEDCVAAERRDDEDDDGKVNDWNEESLLVYVVSLYLNGCSNHVFE